MKFTVKDVFPLLCCPDAVLIDINGRQYNVKEKDQKEPDEFVLEHFQNHVVEDIAAYDENCYVITLKVIPVIEEVSK